MIMDTKAPYDKNSLTKPVRTREWTEMDILKKILFELRSIKEILEKPKKNYIGHADHLTGGF
jgi:hypothetical protein